MITLVKQEQEKGCGIAAIAMLLGRTYQQVLFDWPKVIEQSDVYEDGKVIGKTPVTYNDFTNDGTCNQVVDAYLAEKGYAIQRKYKHKSWMRQDRDIWPPLPFAPAHLCEVKTNSRHFVVMDNLGMVFDPHFGADRRLKDYADTYSVAGIWKIG